MLSINNNLMATNAARNLRTNYGRLSDSVQRLSTGLRVNSADDDAAGLAIRELMRSDIAALNQGARNANDAISMLQVADGALAIIDEKLIRMKELAEQAATGTYDSTQRLIIASEFQAMGSEIDRIARATDFNGIHLLDGSLSGTHNGSATQPKGAMKIHFGSGNDSAEDYYYVKIADCGTRGLGLHNFIGGGQVEVEPGLQWILDDAQIDWENNKLVVDVPTRIAGPTFQSPQAIASMPGFDYYALPVGLENITATSAAPNKSGTHKPHISLFTKDGTQLTGVNPNRDWEFSNQPQFTPTGQIWWNMINGDQVVANLVNGGVLDAGATYNGNNIIYKAGESVTAGGTTISIQAGMSEYFSTEEVVFIDKITSDLVFTIGGHDTPGPPNYCNVYSLKIEADITPELKARLQGKVVGSETALMEIRTQDEAQEALVRLKDAIVAKDGIRANLGAMQNRLENTVANISIQRENLMAAESRISDMDVAREMTDFVRNQILTQSATAMLSQANSMPTMMSRLLNG